jgi:DNA repair exonuclease SbcCD ATPase subunit
MSTDALHVRELRVRRLYGIDLDGLGATDLGAGVNVIYGPNGRGKTTLGHAIHGLLWPDALREHRPTLEGRFTLDAEDWRVDLDAGLARYSLRGRDATPPLIDGADRHRYRLSLHELLKADGADFAQAIRRDAVGGMDVDAAAEALEFRPASPRAGSLTKLVATRHERVRAVQAEQSALRNDVRVLDALRAEREEAEAALGRVTLYEHALACLRARHEEEDARARLDALPAVLERVRGDEPERLDDLRAELEDLERQRDVAREDLARAEATRDANLVARSGRPPSPVVELRERIQALKDAEGALREAERRVTELADAEARAWQRIEGALDEDAAERIDSSLVATLEGFVQKTERLRAEAKAWEALKQILGDEPTDAIEEELGAARDGIRCLQDWLREAAAEGDTPAPNARPVAFGAAALLLVLGAALGVLWHPAAFLLVAGAAVLALVATMLRSPRRAAPAAAAQRFARLPLAPPSAWTVDAVSVRLDALERERAAHEVRLARAQRREASRTGREQLAALIREIEEESSMLGQRMGLRPPIGQESTFFYIVRCVADWQGARRTRQGAEAATAEARRQRDAARTAISDRLATFGLGSVQDAAEASDVLHRLEDAYRALETAERDLADAARRLRESDASADRTRAAIAELFETLDLTPDAGGHALRELCSHLDAYRARRDAWHTARTRHEDAQARLVATSGYTPELLDRPEADVDSDLDAARALAGRRDELSEQITRIDERVQHARGGHQLETARAEHEAALDDLERDYEATCDSVLGHLLATHLADATRDQQLPPVFHRARELFGRFTRHVYELRLDARDGVFYAHDTLRERDFGVEQLSSGTRVQLLLAVRIAFIEQQERGCKLPVVLDEALANSDDERAQAVIEAVLHLCRDGRQVFYFSAQDDEVAKWKRIAAEHPDVECRFIPLEGASPVADIARDDVSTTLFPPVPDPASLTHTAYGHRLGVPPWSPRQPVGALHLWYLVDCPQTLHGLLEQGFTHWGPLAALGRHGNLTGAGIGASAYSRLALCADALDAWGAAWLVGRGRPVDRAVLEDSGAVSDTFMDRVTELCHELDGDAAALIEHLRGSAVRGFQSRMTERLDAYLEEHGYIDPRPRLSQDDCWQRVVERVAGGTGASGVPLSEVRRFLERVHQGVPAEVVATSGEMG